VKYLLTAEQLIGFEKTIADAYNSGVIRAPVHLSGGNEEQLIKIFKDVDEQDWVCSAWRSHYHCLLKGVPTQTFMEDIWAGRSITLCYPEQRVITSAIVGGIIPIALGIALGIKRQGGTEKVWCFVGDMTAVGGAFHEALNYAVGSDLPIKFIIEDNGKSVGTDTRDAWGPDSKSVLDLYDYEFPYSSYIYYYQYELPWPHAGAGKWVEF
jgi:pyruvate dehydrogenase E1 component alpha subunit